MPLACRAGELRSRSGAKAVVRARSTESHVMTDSAPGHSASEAPEPGDTPRERVRAAFERNARLLSARTTVGRGTAVTRARLEAEDGLACEVTEGDWRVTVDFSPKAGGRGQGPNPGMLGRGALASCLAIGYAMWAAHRDVVLTSIDVEVRADYDSGPSYGARTGTPGYQRVRYVVTVTSDAPEEAVRRVLDEAEAHSPYYAVFTHPQRLERELRLERPRR
jgi:uncharacterized OsmC-like protein